MLSAQNEGAVNTKSTVKSLKITSTINILGGGGEGINILT